MTMDIDTSTFRTGRAVGGEQARAKLASIIEAGKARAFDTYQHAMSAVIDDSLVRDNALVFSETDGKAMLHGVPLTEHALSQTCTRYGMPPAYARELLASDSDVVRAIVPEVLETRARAEGKGRALVRAQGGVIRAVLSDSYKRIDSRPMINTFVKACQSQSLVPIDGHVTDTRISIKAIMSQIVEPVPGEMMALGMQLKTSDYGAGALVCSMFALRLLCVNGMTLEQVMKQVHLGRKMDEGTFSQRTYTLDAATSQSALNDTLRKSLQPSNVTSVVNMIRESMVGGAQYSAKDRLEKLQKKGTLTKAEAKAIGEVYIEPDIEKLPPGNSDFRLANAISWFAHSNEHSGDRRLDLEKLAGDLITKPG
jgi:hypothetical protein